MSDSESDVEGRALRDILYDAAGYLCKLGTNLRLRAERIQERKLPNTHSIRKVTDKVLLICDLSKKSIEKVEDVVRKGLLSDGQESKRTSTSSLHRRKSVTAAEESSKSSCRQEGAKFQKVGNNLIIIPDGVQLDHFMSCRIRAQSLPASSLHKYRVYSESPPNPEKKSMRRKTDEAYNKESTSKNEEKGSKHKIHDTISHPTSNIISDDKRDKYDENKSKTKSKLEPNIPKSSKVDRKEGIMKNFKIPKNYPISPDSKKVCSLSHSSEDIIKVSSSSRKESIEDAFNKKRAFSTERANVQESKERADYKKISDFHDKSHGNKKADSGEIEKSKTIKNTQDIQKTIDSKEKSFGKLRADSEEREENNSSEERRHSNKRTDHKEKFDGLDRVGSEEEIERNKSTEERSDSQKITEGKEDLDGKERVGSEDIEENKSSDERGDIKKRTECKENLDVKERAVSEEIEKNKSSLERRDSQKRIESKEKFDRKERSGSEEIEEYQSSDERRHCQKKTDRKERGSSEKNKSDYEKRKLRMEREDSENESNSSGNVELVGVIEKQTDSEKVDTLSKTKALSASPDKKKSLKKRRIIRISSSEESDTNKEKQIPTSRDDLLIKVNKAQVFNEDTEGTYKEKDEHTSKFKFSKQSSFCLEKTEKELQNTDNLVSKNVHMESQILIPPAEETDTRVTNLNITNTEGNSTDTKISQEKSGSPSVEDCPIDKADNSTTKHTEDNINITTEHANASTSESVHLTTYEVLDTASTKNDHTKEDNLEIVELNIESKLKEHKDSDHFVENINPVEMEINADESAPIPREKSPILHSTLVCNFDEENSKSSKDGTNDNNNTNSGAVSAGDDDSQSSQASSSRPFLKCIDLSKLLKTPVKDALLMEEEDTSSAKIMKQTIKPKAAQNLFKNKIVSNKKPVKVSRPSKQKLSKVIEIEDSDSDQYTPCNVSVQSSKYVADNFKPKLFKIHVTKLPSFSDDFLRKHKLTRITQLGSIVAQISVKNVQVNDTAKTDLLNESSDSSHSSEQRSKRRTSGESRKAKRKRVMESIRAKKMLLSYSSSSDSENSFRKKHKKKDDSSKETSSGENGVMNKIRTDVDIHKRKLLTSSSSSIEDEDSINHKLKELEKEVNAKDDQTNGDTTRGSPDEKNNEKKNERASSKTSSISQVDGNDDNITGSESEMGRTTRGRSATSTAQNSDATENDDKIIDTLTNLKSLSKKNKSRDSPSSTSENSSRKRSKNEMKQSVLQDEVLLEAQSKSSSDSEQTDAGTVADGNGDPAGELAREDLLEDTDSEGTPHAKESDSASTKSNGDAKAEGKKKPRKGKPSKVVELDSTDKDDSDTEDIKVRRRKAEVISSDSDAGATKRKTAEKDSDYDEASAASDDSAENFKRTKRKAKKSSDSESAGKSSVEGNKKKRRRIKQVQDSDEGSGSDSENDGKKGGRKNIRKVMGKNQLEEATKKAAREERERIARITERQKLYNSTAFDESGKPDEIKLDKVVLDFDPETKEPLIEVDRGIVKKLKPHQANGIKFMWDACFESVKQIKKGNGSGCILAHCMGLGKTLQVVSLIHTLLSHEDLTKVRRVLVVCPLSTVLNWVHELRMWISHAENNKDLDIYELSRHKQNNERSYQLREWMETGGVCVLGYEMFRNLSADNTKKYRKKMLATLQESLVNPGPDLVICDEGHLLKNEKTSLSQAMNRVRTLRRIVLTGTPLQNNLKEYYCMVQFVKPNLLGKYSEYLNRFVNPITNGQYTNSTEHDIRVMKRRSHVLHKMLDGAVQRRDYSVLAPFLPPKHEYVLFITLTEVQIKLYQHYLDNYSRRQQAGRSSGFLFPDFQALQRIWTHPLVLKANSERYEIAQQKKRDREEDSEGSLVDFLDDDSTPEESTTEEETDVSEASDDSRKKRKKKSLKKSKSKSEKAEKPDKVDKDAAGSGAGGRRSTRANPGEIEDIDMKFLKDPDEPRAENPTEWWIKLVEEQELDDMRNSNKLILLFDILRQCEAIGDKLLVFSQSLYSLDLIEHFLSKIDDATQMGKVEETLGGHVGSWSPGIDYFRLDGSTSCENRSIWCKNFNREDNPRARLFLISTRAGGLGINLVAANRVVIFDVSWNPSHDVQSIFRVYRFGQKKPCYVYRFLAMGTMEEKIYERQVTKQAISKRVIDEQQIDRHYNENDLQELYTFQPQPEQPRPVPLLPKDRLFAEMLKDHDKLIYRYHEHDSLLENKEEETLTEEERKAAWEDFENEKNRPPPAPFPNPGFMPQMNGMNNMMQQQQLMLATVLSMLRKEYPGLTEQQIANILPQILYGDPSLMQKMGGMGVGMMGGMGGATSSLSFQPTWQQQQQMQLQRIQQQQAMNSGGGVKYYAGGLGSRDPMSMALQQKHQREMMLNSTGDRLRDMLVGAVPGARPRQPPPTPSGEVVNLDDSE